MALTRGATHAQISRRITVEAQGRKSGFKTIRQWLAAENADALLWKNDRKDWLVVMDERHMRDLVDTAPSILASHAKV